METTPFLMALSAALLHALWNVLLKQSGDRLVAMTLLAMGAAIPALIALPFLPLPPADSWPFLVSSILLHTGYNLFLVAAYNQGGLAQIYPLARGSAPLLLLPISYFWLDGTLSNLAVLGVVITLAGFMVLGLVGKTTQKAYILALITGGFIAAYSLSDGLGARAAGNPHVYAAWLFALEGLTILPFAMVRRGKELGAALKAQWRQGFLAGILSLAAYWLVIWAMTLAPIVLVSAIRETSVVMAVLFAGLILKEPIRKRQVTAALCVAVGIVLLKTG